jgi:hypothetical protein
MDVIDAGGKAAQRPTFPHPALTAQTPAAPLPPTQTPPSEKTGETPKTGQNGEQAEMELANVPLPPRRPTSLASASSVSMSLTYATRRRLEPIVLPKIITGAQPILPSDFTAFAYAAIER